MTGFQREPRQPSGPPWMTSTPSRSGPHPAKTKTGIRSPSGRDTDATSGVTSPLVAASAFDTVRRTAAEPPDQKYASGVITGDSNVNPRRLESPDQTTGVRKSMTPASGSATSTTRVHPHPVCGWTAEWMHGQPVDSVLLAR